MRVRLFQALLIGDLEDEVNEFLISMEGIKGTVVSVDFWSAGDDIPYQHAAIFWEVKER